MPEDVKGRLVSVAGAAFADKGFDAVGIREICQRAGANLAAVHYHFGDKQGLYVACLRHAQSCRVDELAAAAWPADMLPNEKLRAFIRGTLESKLDSSRPQWHLDLMLREMSRPTDACRGIIEDYIRPMSETLGGILRELMPVVPTDAQLWMIQFSIISQVLFYHDHQEVARGLVGSQEFESMTVDILTDHITRFSLAALGAGTSFREALAAASAPPRSVPSGQWSSRG